MSRATGPELQRAIRFLSDPGLAKGEVLLSGRPDYDGLARRASELGYDLSPGAVEDAFRAIIRARLVALRGLSRADGVRSPPN